MSHQGRANEIVIALYKPHAGQDAALRALVESHVPALRRAGLITERPSVLMRSSDGTFVEIFEWVPGGAERAHAHPEIGPLWGAMSEVADFTSLADLPEARGRFPHFTPA